MTADQLTALTATLRDELRHRIRPMTGRDPGEPGRTSTPLELLYDLTYVIAFAVAATQLADLIGKGEAAAGIGAYAFAIFAVTWAWLNFTWFSSAYDNDDALYRIATIIQTVGVIVLSFGLPGSFAAAARGESPNDPLMIVGYVIMRVPLIVLWLRAAHEDPARRVTARAYAIVIAVAQTGWVLTAVPGLPVAAVVIALAALAAAEMVAPVVVERRFGAAPWNAGHIAERFGLLTLITLGEVVAAMTEAVGSLVHEHDWSPAAVVIISAGLVLTAALWWTYFLIPSRTVLMRWPDRTWAWRYVHLPIFGAIAAIGAGFRVAAGAVAEESLTMAQITVALVVPVATVLFLIFVLWSVLMHAADLTHVPLFLLSLCPLAVALAVGLTTGATRLDLSDGSELAAFVAVFVLVALSPVIEVVGHEIVGFRHTVRALERTGSH